MSRRFVDPELLPFIQRPAGADGEFTEDQIEAYVASLGQLTRPRVGVTTEDVTIPGLDGDPNVLIRVFTPEEAPSAQARGLLVSLHGGGWTMGSIEDTYHDCADWALGANIVVVDVEYRLAPDNPHPAALRDAIAALHWAARQAESLGVDPDRIGIGGRSAGANLAAGATLWVRDHGGPSIAFQLLDVPDRKSVV